MSHRLVSALTAAALAAAATALPVAAQGRDTTAPQASAAPDLAAEILTCRKLGDGALRLVCYDQLETGAPVAEYTGAGSRIIPAFDVTGPTRLIFESMDAIMVVYLLDASQSVVQNLHQAGTGKGSFLIDKPGRYSIQVNASGGWRIRLQTE